MAGIDDTSGTKLDIIHLTDVATDDATKQVAAYKRKAQMLLTSWRQAFSTQDANRDYQLEDGENLKLRSSNDAQLLAEHTLADNTRIRFDYDKGRAKDKLIVTAYEASGEVLTVTSTLADQYDQLAGLLFVCAGIESQHHSA